MLWAIGGQPRLLVPSELWSAMGTDERTSLLLHELAHLKRRDHWVRWLELVIGGLYWWHPAVWWIRRSLREAEEQCCDAWVIWAMPKGAKTYATALLTVLEFVSGARIAPATASATSGNGHVSSLKRRLRMIVRAQTPKGLSWAGCFAVLGTAALLLPLAPTWAQRPERDQPSIDAENLDNPDFSELVLDEQDRIQPKPERNGNTAVIEDGIEQRALQIDENLEARILDEFQRDAGVISLKDAIIEMQKERDRYRSGNDPSRRVLQKELDKLNAEYNTLWRQKHEEFRKQLTPVVVGPPPKPQDDDKADRRKDYTKDDQGHTTSERLEQRVKDLLVIIHREMGPYYDEVQKALEKSVDDLHKALEKENVSVDDLKKSLEKSYEEIRQALAKGGPVDKELREAWERSRRELRDKWLKSREEMRQDLRDRVESARRWQRESARDARKSRDQGKAEPDRGTDAKSQDKPGQDELDNARREVRELQQQLLRAGRRLMELQRREAQRNSALRRPGDPFGKRTPDRDQKEQDLPREGETRTPRSPGMARTPATPRQATPPNARTPFAPPREAAPGAGARPIPAAILNTTDASASSTTSSIDSSRSWKS